MLFSTSYSQNLKIYGTVRDASTNEPLAFTNILFNNTFTGTTTSLNGKFEAELPPARHELLISYVGYKTDKIIVELENSNVELDIYLVSTGVLLQEVSVFAANTTDEKTVSSLSMQSKQIKEISSVFPDVFRSIQALPGIAVNNEFSAKFNVRGGNYDENLVLVNGAQVYEPFHVKEADNASIGIFNIDLMKSVNIMTGGFSAQYGDRLSSVLNIEYREGNRERHTGAVTLSLTNFDTFIEGPIGSSGSYIFGARKSYFEYVLSLLEEDDDVRPSFYDVQGVLTYNLSDADKIQFKFIHAGDDFELKPAPEINGPYNYTGTIYNQPASFSEGNSNIQDVEANYYSNLFDLQYQTFLSNKTLLNTSVSFYKQIDDVYAIENADYYFEADANNYYFFRSNFHDLLDNDLTIETWEAKTSLDYRVNPFYDIKTGLSYSIINYKQYLLDERYRDISQNIDSFPDTLNYRVDESEQGIPEDINADSYKIAGYMENVIQLNDRFIFNIGARFDYFKFNEDLSFSPRISGSYQLDENTSLHAAWGHYYQSPIYRQLAYSFPSDTNTQSQKAVHYILGLERKIYFNDNISSLTIKIEGYYKNYTNLISSERDAGGNVHYSRFNDAKGYAKGIDFYSALSLGDYYGWISYGLLFAKEDLLNDDVGEFPRYTDQRHTFSFVNNFNLGQAWDLNLRFTYGSGFAHTPFYITFDTENQRNVWTEGEKNSAHLPTYSRVDIRLSKGFTVWSLPALLFLDVSNLFNNKNVVSIRYRYNRNGNPYIEELELFPIIPTIGFTLKF